ncbi:hypothetical protein KC354_g9411 [Hortaea werneckii]|nr:hypothetical protein KC354_g9411 [Hortaea werneckii]
MGAAAATATAGGQGGVYQDRYGGYWEMDCGYYFSGSTYWDGAYQGTNGIGVYSCFNGCANRPGCVGFTYYGTSTGPTTGGGRCFHFFNGQQGNLSYNPSYLYADAGSYSLFGSAYLLQANENLLCPTYNGTYFLDAQGQAYYILCGYGSTSQYQNTAARDGPACLALCDAQAQCIGVTVVYGGAESNANNNANCYLASAGLNTIANTRNVLAVRTTMPSFLPTTTTTTTTSTRSTATAPVTPTAPPPSFACPADDIQQLQENGQNYYVGCGMVAQGTTSAAYTATNSWNDCFGLVPSDAYHIGAVKAAYYGWQVTTTTTTTTSSSQPFTTTTTSATTSTTTTTTSSSSSAAPQTVTYTYVSSYPVTYTTSYVTTAVSTAPGSTVISTYVTTDNGDINGTNHGNINSSGLNKYTYNHGNIDGKNHRNIDSPGLDKYTNNYCNINRTNHSNINTSCINKHINNHSDLNRAIYCYFNRTNHIHSSGIDKYIDHHTKDHGDIHRKNHSNFYRAIYSDLDRKDYGDIYRTDDCDIHRTDDCDIHRTDDCDIHRTDDCDIHRTDDCDIHRAIYSDLDRKDHCNIDRTNDCDIYRATDGDYDGHIYGKDYCDIYRATDRYYDGHIYRAIDRDYDGHIDRANHGTSNPNIYDCIIIPSHHGDCKHSIWLDHNPDYKLLCDIHGNQHDSGLFDGSSPYGNIYHCCTDGDTNYGILIRSHIYHILSCHGYGNYIDSRLDRHFHLRLVVSTQVSSYGVTTTAPGTYADDAPTWRTADYRVELKPINDRGRVMLTRNTSFDGKNHCANHNCINSASIDHYPDSANDRAYRSSSKSILCLKPNNSQVVSTFLSTIPVTETYTTLSSYPYTYTLVSTASGSTITETSVAYRTTTQTSLQVSTAVSTAYSTIVSTQTVSGPTVVSTVTYTTSYVSTYLTSYPVTTILVSTAQGSTVTTESISYATSTERTTIVSSYIGTATETTTASGPTQTVSGPTQTESGPTQTISGPTQTIQGPTQTQVITTSYVETYTTSYPVTETLPGSTEVTISYATTTVERTVVSSYISTERISVTQTQEVTTTQAASTLYGTTTQPGVTIYGTVTATHERFERHSARVFVKQ